MCVYSVIMDSFKPIPLDQWTRPAFTEALEILEKVKALDEKLGQRDCEDAKKMGILQKIEQRLASVEAALKKKKGRNNGTKNKEE
jgi:hypothetical protein